MESVRNALGSETRPGDAAAGEAGALALEPANPGTTIPDPLSILDQARDAIVILGLDGAVRYWNRAAERIFEWPGSDALQRHAQDFLWEDPRSGDDALSGVLASGGWNGELAVVTKSGGRRLVESRWSLLRDERTQSRSVLTMHTDITEKTKLEDQFSRAQKLESIGAIARGFAHDLNNVLGPIVMAVDLVKMTTKSPRELDLLETVEVSAKHGAAIVKQMLSLTRTRIFASDADLEAPAGGEDDGLPRGHGELILLIDDHPSIRLITGRTLEAYGYQVITACDGAEGLEKYSARRGEIALAIMDSILPDMTGAEAIRALRECDPFVKIIASGGVNMKGAEEEAVRSGVRVLLRKPYTVERLLAVVEEALRAGKSD